MAWDSLGGKRRSALQDQLVREQVRAVTAGSAYWKARFAELGRQPGSVRTVADLAAVPAVGERDVSPSGDPAAMAALVLHGGERHFALHASGPTLRRAMRKRATRSAEYRRIVSQETRATSFAWGGLGFRFPIASTRGDLDVLTRAGARMWAVLGATADDALLATLPGTAGVEHAALHYAALGAGAPALFPGDDPAEVAAAARLAPPTVLAVATEGAVELIAALADSDVPLPRLRLLVLVGAPSDAERAAATDALTAAGVADASVLAVHVPSGGRLPWAECAAGAGLHTYPDLDLVQVVDADTGEPTEGGGEVVLTQLGMRGSALLRWRTGDLVGAVATDPCPSCQRRVPRLMGLRRAALVVATETGRALDLRAVAGALAGRGDLGDWRVVVGGRARDGRRQVVVHVAPTGDPGAAAVGAAADIRAAAGMLPSQLVVAEDGSMPALDGEPLTARMLLRR